MRSTFASHTFAAGEAQVALRRGVEDDRTPVPAGSPELLGTSSEPGDGHEPSHDRGVEHVLEQRPRETPADIDQRAGRRRDRDPVRSTVRSTPGSDVGRWCRRTTAGAPSADDRRPRVQAAERAVRDRASALDDTPHRRPRARSAIVDGTPVAVRRDRHSVDTRGELVPSSRSRRRRPSVARTRQPAPAEREAGTPRSARSCSETDDTIGRVACTIRDEPRESSRRRADPSSRQRHVSDMKQIATFCRGVGRSGWRRGGRDEQVVGGLPEVRDAGERARPGGGGRHRRRVQRGRRLAGERRDHAGDRGDLRRSRTSTTSRSRSTAG